MSEALMRRLVTVGRFRLYYADRRTFLEPGFHLWTGKRHIRVLPIPKLGTHP